MRLEIVRRALAARRRSLLGWGLGVIAYMALIVFSYPAIRDQQSFTDLIEDYPEWVQQIMGLGSGLEITSPAGYLNSQVFSNVLPLVLLIFLIAFAVKETAGEEADGTMDLALAHPLRRERYLLEKLGAMVLAGLLLAALTTLSLIGPAPLVDMELAVGGMIAAVASVFVLSLVFAVLAFAIASVTGRRGIALGVASGAAVTMYVLWGLATLVDALDVTRFINPFHWGLAGDPILNGLQLGNVALLLAAVVALSATAVWGFKRRDLKV